MRLRIAFLLTLTALLVAGCTAPKEAAVAPSLPAVGADEVTPQSVTGSTGAVGGSVKNSPPTFVSYSPDATIGENRGGFVVVLQGSVKDKNAEQDVASIAVASVGPAVLGGTHVVTSAEKNATGEPGEFGADGFKVWSATLGDGILNFKYRQAFPAFTPAGVYNFTATVKDLPGSAATSAAAVITLSSFSDITISPTPVGADGASLAGQNWGQWVAEAGDKNVEASNYIKLVNTGDVGNSRIVIDLASQFVGASDPAFVIPAGSKVQFAWFEDTTPATSAPSEGTFTWLPANTESSVTVQFSGKGNVIYVKYRITELPEILPPQPYGISFTVTELAA